LPWPSTARAEELVERELAVEDVAAHEAEFPLEVQRREEAARDDASPEIRGEAVDVIDDRVGRPLALRIPCALAGKSVAEMLAEEARDMGPGGRKGLVDRARNEHLDDGLARPPLLAGDGVRAIHVGQ